MRRRLVLALSVVLVLVAGACSSDDAASSDTSTPPAPQPSTTAVTTSRPSSPLLAFHAVLAEVEPPCDELNVEEGQLVVAEPTAEQPALCLVLAPAALDDSALAAATIDPTLGPSDGAVAVFVEFDQLGAVAFDELAAAQVGERVAVLVEGDLVSAPLVQQGSFGGQAVVSPLDAETAQRLVTAVGQ